MLANGIFRATGWPVVVVALMLTTMAAAGATARARWATPDRFVSLKDETSATELGPRDGRSIAEAADAEAYAVKVRNGTPVATFVVKSYGGGAPIATWGQYLANSLASSPFANDATIGPVRTFSLGGVDCAVADVERVTGGVSFRERYYALPAGERWTFVKLLARSEDFPSAAEAVDRVVEGTRGLARSTQPDPVLAETGRKRLFVIGAAGLAVAVVVAWLRRWLTKRKS